MPSITDAVQGATQGVFASGGTTAPASQQAGQTPLAPNVWVGSADNKLATADVYAPPGQPSVINDIENLFSKFNFSITDVLRGGKFVAANMGRLSFAAQALTHGDIISRVLGASSLTKTVLNGLGAAGLGNISASITAGINMAQGSVGAAVGSIGNEVYASLGGVVQQFKNVDPTNLTAVGTAINTLTGNGYFSLSDNGAKISLFAGLIKTASSYGMPNSYAGLMASITDRNMIGQITMRVLPTIVSNSDVHSLMSIGVTLGARAAYAYNPNLIANFSSNYSVPPAADASGRVDYTTCYSGITGAYAAVDPNWSTYTRPATATNPDGSISQIPDTAFNLNSVMNGSDDFLKVIGQGIQTTANRADKVMALAKVVPQSTVAAKLAAQFPRTVFSGNNQATNVTQDPLALATGAPISRGSSTTYSNVAPNTGKTPKDMYDVSNASFDPVTGLYTFPDGRVQASGTFTAPDTSGYSEKSITFS